MRLLIPAAVLAVAAACADAGDPPADAAPPAPDVPAAAAPSAEVLRTYTAPADTLRVRTGEVFRVAVPSDPSSGASWALAGMAGLGPLRVTDQRSEGTPGQAGGSESWRVEATEAGTGVISVVALDPGTASEPADTTRFHVVVQ